MKTVKLTANTQKDLLDSLLKRSPNNYSEYEDVVAEIVNQVRLNGDQAVFEYTKRFDKWDINANTIRVKESEIDEAFEVIDREFVEVLKRTAANI